VIDIYVTVTQKQASTRVPLYVQPNQQHMNIALYRHINKAKITETIIKQTTLE